MGFNTELGYVLRLTTSTRFSVGSIHKVVGWTDYGTPMIRINGRMWECFEENWESCRSFEEKLKEILE